MSSWRDGTEARLLANLARAKAREEDDKKASRATEVRWLNCSTKLRRDPYGTEMAGRKAHAVPHFSGEALDDLQFRKSLCGRRAKHGWCVDLHNEPCLICMKLAEKRGFNGPED